MIKPTLAIASAFAADASSCTPLWTKMPDAISVTGSAAVSARLAVAPSTTATARTADLLIVLAKNRRSPARARGPAWRSIGASTREQETNRIGIPRGYHAIAAIFGACDVRPVKRVTSRLRLDTANPSTSLIRHALARRGLPRGRLRLRPRPSSFAIDERCSEYAGAVSG